MKSRRAKYAMLMMILIASICVTAKLTTDAVREDMLATMAVSAEIPEDEKPDEILEFRREREQLRRMQRDQLNEIIYDSGADETIVRSAQEQLLGIMESESLELTLESMLNIRGFEDALVVINGESMNVILRSSGLDRTETALILDMIANETEISSGNVKIIPIN